MIDEFEYKTTLNGAVVSVWLSVDWDDGNAIPHFDAVFYEDQDVTAILSNEQIAELEMEAEKGFWESGWESANGY
jgi:hypothetical protein